MEHISQKKKLSKDQNVPIVTEKTPEKEPEPVEAVPQEQAQAAPAQAVLFDLSKFPKDKVKMAEELGVPITFIADTMNSWAASVEARFNVLAEGVQKNPERTIELLQQEAKKAREQYVKEHPEAAASPGGSQIGGGGLAQILPLLGPLLGSGGTDQLTQTFMAAVMQNGLEAMSYGNALVKAIMTRIAPEMANEVTAKMLPKATT